MQPTAFQAPQDLIPYNNEQVLVVGCGSQPATHPGQPHRIPAGNIATGATVSIPLQVTYTMDINPAMHPHRVGSFWIEDHTEDLPSAAFRLIYFENLPGGLLADRGWCLTAMRAARRLLSQNGMLIIRSGLGVVNPGSALDVAMQDTFGAGNVILNQDQYGVYLDIRAQK
jgi:hypothetical protein